jgi:hypothetical protein
MHDIHKCQEAPAQEPQGENLLTTCRVSRKQAQGKPAPDPTETIGGVS